MHEVGHTLGLRHNFKASKWLSLKDMNDPEKTQRLPGRLGDGLQPGEHRPQGLEAGRLLRDDARPV